MFRFLIFIGILISMNLFSSALFGQNNSFPSYEEEWKIIDSLLGQRLPKSALEKVLPLYAKVSKEDNTPQIIKCINTKLRLESQLQDVQAEKVFQGIGLEAEISKHSAITQAVLSSLAAASFGEYANNNYWRFQNRTATQKYVNTDIETWSLAQIAEKTSDLYFQSIKDKNILQAATTITYEAIVTEKSNLELRPTLYDVLLYEAVDHFKSETTYLSAPAYNFYVEGEEAFANSNTFISHTYTTKDSTSYKWHTLQLLQQAEAFHVKDTDPLALVDWTLTRLDFVQANSIESNKIELYITALEKLSVQFQNKPAEADIWAALAAAYYTQGQRYTPSPIAQGKLDKKKALEMCEKTILKYPSTVAASKCIAIKENIIRVMVQAQNEAVIPANSSILLQISYTNLAKAHIRIYKVPTSPYKGIDYGQGNQEENLAIIKKLPLVNSYIFDLPQEGDYQNHTTEVMLKELPLGRYIVLISKDANFQYDQNNSDLELYQGAIQVSNIAYFIEQGHNTNEISYYTTDRTTGKPMPNVEVGIYKYNTRNNMYRTTTLFTNNDGKATYTASTEYENVSPHFTTKKDNLFIGEQGIYKGHDGEPASNFVHFFTDRKLYRPSQIIYFKGLAMVYDKDRKPSILKNKKVEVYFRDVNNKEITKQTFTTNDYGTFNGNFTAPSTGLLGTMTIQALIRNINGYTGYANIQVEEYKRPKFEVQIEKPKIAYKLDDKVIVKGNAKAFAGNNIDAAVVKYRVVRNVRFPYWRWGWCGWRNPYANVPSMEITNGTTTTNEKGEMEIPFIAIPDKSIPSKEQPVFTYTVYADVTDINGETHSTQNSISVGYVAMEASIDVPAVWDIQEKLSLKITTNNLNGEPEPAEGTIKIEALQMPITNYNNRYWNYPDLPSIKEDEFRKNFPNLPYKDENKLEQLKVSSQLYTTSISTPKTKEIALQDIAKWKEGSYKITFTTKDKYGVPITVEKYLTVYDSKQKTLPSTLEPFSTTNKDKYEPQDIAKIMLKTAHKQGYAYCKVYHKKTVLVEKWIELPANYVMEIPIKEEYRGNISYTITTIKNNRVYTEASIIAVPWSNKDLKIEYSTFREKLYPGQPEEWTIKITGNKKEIVAAEVLATMYDASLDAIGGTNKWQAGYFPTNDVTMGLDATQNFQPASYNKFYTNGKYFDTKRYIYPLLVARNHYYLNDYLNANGLYGMADVAVSGSVAMESAAPSSNMKMTLGVDANQKAGKRMAAMDGDGVNEQQKSIQEKDNKLPTDFSQVAIRTNLKETVFFFPQLYTDAQGNVLLKFTMNEALTKWKLLLFAHTKDLQTASEEKFVQTQKDLMVVPNAPRFLRGNDKLTFAAKISNLVDKPISGKATLQLFDAISLKPIDALFQPTASIVDFSTQAKQSTVVTWNLQVPEGVGAVTYRVIAKADDFSDGEEGTLPILSNKLLVTESMPLPMKGNEKKNFVFKSMLEKSSSTTLRHQQFTLEFTENPAWYAVQALPYLMEYPYECTEQVFSRYYANSLSASIVNKYPKIKTVFEQWKGTDAMVSNLHKNQELKSALLEETPWVLQSENEETQRKNIALLFDLNKLAYEENSAITKLVDRQLANGSFSWFPGGEESWYITQYLVQGFGHLNKLGVKNTQQDSRVATMLQKAINFIDIEIAEDYASLKRNNKDTKVDLLHSTAIQYLYARTFFMDQPIPNGSQEAYDYFMAQSKKYWTTKSNYMQGMIALALFRKGDITTANDIIASLKERAITHEELGTYWKNEGGWYWYQAPNETHTLLLEAFATISKDTKMIENLKIWLLKNKQTNDWKTTRATANAVYALLSTGSDWLAETQPIKIQIAGKPLDESSIKKQAGTGYFKTKWNSEQITTNMANISVDNPNNTIAWGAAYWQYMEEIDKIKDFKETPLTISKQLFKEINTDRGIQMIPITEGTALTTGDKIKVRIEIKVDRAMEYLHLKDMRAAGLEPINILSRYKWQGGLGYYESTKDASTNFFISYLPKGTHVFEYSLVATNKGDFSNGITTMQCMYAPEFTSHSNGIRVIIK